MSNPDFNKMTGPELVSWYNEHAHKPVRRFSSRAAAITRCERLVDAMRFDRPQEAEPTVPEESNMTETNQTETNSTADQNAEISAHVTGAIRSWQDPEIRARRSSRMKVYVPQTGETYASMLKAFNALELDPKDHVKIRMQTRAEGTVEFAGFTFERVDEE